MQVSAQGFSRRSLLGALSPVMFAPREANWVLGVWSSWDTANIGDIGHPPGLLRTIDRAKHERTRLGGQIRHQ